MENKVKNSSEKFPGQEPCCRVGGQDPELPQRVHLSPHHHTFISGFREPSTKPVNVPKGQSLQLRAWLSPPSILLQFLYLPCNQTGIGRRKREAGKRTRAPEIGSLERNTWSLMPEASSLSMKRILQKCCQTVEGLGLLSLYIWNQM